MAFPTTAEDIQNLVSLANKEGVSLTARSAGTSLAGQTTGKGVIMDVSRFMTRILSIHPETKTAKVEPGVIRDSLNRASSAHDLFFGPDTSTTSRCMIGGMIGNNSAGSFSVKYKTTREHVKEMEVVLSDGSTTHFRPLSKEELDKKCELDSFEGHIYRSIIELLKEHKELIEASYPHPEIIRRNTGYALDRLLEMEPFTKGGRPFNLCELLCGSEGTLAITTSATLNLVEQPARQLLIIPQFEHLNEAMEATRLAVSLEPSAVELVDHIILDATKENLEQQKNRFFLEGSPRYILIIQFDGETKKELVEKAAKLRSTLKDEGLGVAFPVISEPEMMDRVWELRKAGLGLLMGLGTESRTPAFCEDTSVRVEDLPEYVNDFRGLLEKYKTDCVFYAHASVGELHFRPMIDTTTEEGISMMKEMAGDVASLVKKYKGSLSGEHGDGRARSPYIEYVLGKEMMPVLQKVKEIWDPAYLFNPGKIVDPEPMDAGLRYSPEYRRAHEETIFNYRKEGGFGNAIELCNGAGVCRKLAESGGTMCPSYQVTKEEKDSTRGRANVFRQVFSGEDPSAFSSNELKEALDLCLSCKACKSECPANVDMAKMKAEFMNGWHKTNGSQLSERFFTSTSSLYTLGSLFPAMTNFLTGTSLSRSLLSRFFGVDKRRELPKLAKQPFHKWFEKHQPKKDGNPVALFVDVFTNYHEPEVAKSAVSVLENMGFRVELCPVMESGRPQLSKGFLEEAKGIAHRCITGLEEFYSKGIPIVGLEPSEILTFRDEFLDICEEEFYENAQKLAENSFSFEEFIVKNRGLINTKGSGKKIVLHGHCHTKALTGNTSTIEVLQMAGYEVEELKTGCCGMAGSFGYEKEHFDTSMEVGELTVFPSVRGKDKDAIVCAPGFSCRYQIQDGVKEESFHPAVLIARALSLS